MCCPEYLPLCMAFRVIAVTKSSGVCRAQGVAEVAFGLVLCGKPSNTTLLVLVPQPQDPHEPYCMALYALGLDTVAVWFGRALSECRTTAHRHFPLT